MRPERPDVSRVFRSTADASSKTTDAILGITLGFLLGTFSTVGMLLVQRL